MKSSLFPILAACSVLLPVGSLCAADSTTTYGGFVPGKTFTMTVTNATSIRTKGDDLDRDVPVPDGWPDLKVGQTMTFTIGDKGQLIAPGFSIAYKSEKDRLNLYSNNPSFSSPEGEAAAITKSRTEKPRVVRLTFYKLHFSGFTPVTHTVTYKFEK